MKRLILLLMICLAGVSATFGAGKKDGSPLVFFDKTVCDLGTINEKDGVKRCEFRFVNKGNAPLIIYDTTAECGCTRPEYPKNPVSPGKSGKIKVSYNPAGNSGSFVKTITVKCNGNPHKIRLKIRGTVIPK